jgi:hypothetical protein
MKLTPLRLLVPVAVKTGVKRLRRGVAQATRKWRALPDYLILGTQKGGTTSLHNYLCGHPDVATPTRKEIHYFSYNLDKGPAWYRGHFATNAYLRAMSRFRGRRPLCGDTSPDYLFHPHAARRAFELVPEARLIILLRNPADRAFSHYRHRVRKGMEHRSFEAAIAEELALASVDDGTLREDAWYDSLEHAKLSYVTRGLYARQLRRWFAVFPRERFLILRSEDFFADPRAVYANVLEFLGLRQWQPGDMRKYNFFNESEPVPATTRNELENFFNPHNRELTELIGMTFP